MLSVAISAALTLMRLFVGPRVERALDLQSSFCRRGTDQFDDGKTIRKRTAAPVLRDVAEQAVLVLFHLMCRVDNGGHGARARLQPARSSGR
jgi:hypothetical protein